MRTYLDTLSNVQVQFSDKFTVMFGVEDNLKKKYLCMDGDTSILTKTIYIVRNINES
jgi:hypothetical protein